eukprot:1161515-Pelagomonas_calceolata.AAC.3
MMPSITSNSFLVPKFAAFTAIWGMLQATCAYNAHPPPSEHPSALTHQADPDMRWPKGPLLAIAHSCLPSRRIPS